MVALSMRSLTIAIAIVMLLLIPDHCVNAEEVCNGAIGKLEKACMEFVLKPGPQKDPSQGCCQIIKGADVPCVCDHIPKESKDIISMDKVVYVWKYCGNPLQSGSKCGDYTVPPKA